MQTSNAFRVRDSAALWDDLAKLHGAEMTLVAPNKVVVRAENWLAPAPSDDGTEYEIVYVPELVATHLAPNQVAVFFSVDAARPSGSAVAVNAAGEMVRIDLDDIYELSKARFAIPTIERI